MTTTTFLTLLLVLFLNVSKCTRVQDVKTYKPTYQFTLSTDLTDLLTMRESVIVKVSGPAFIKHFKLAPLFIYEIIIDTDNFGIFKIISLYDFLLYSSRFFSLNNI